MSDHHDGQHERSYLKDESVDSLRDENTFLGLKYQPVSTRSPTRQTAITYELEHPQRRDGGGLPSLSPPMKTWTPISLRGWFAISLIVYMLIVAVALEIALHFSNKQHGWRVSSAFSATTGILHYVYTLPPVAVSMILVAFWAWTDVEIKKMQPYIDLAHGNAPASRSMLLDYTTRHAALVSISAYGHSHYIVALSSFMVLVGLAIQPLSASLFTVKQTWWSSPNINVTSFEVPGLDPNFGNLTTFAAAAGFVQAHVLYNATPPNFVNGIWSIGKIEVPSDQVANGTMSADTTAVRSLGHCKAGELGSITPFTNGSGFTVAGTSDGCSVSIPVQSNGALQYGVDVVTCPENSPPDPFKPVVFWTVSQPDPTAGPAYSLVYCTPTFELLNITAFVALQTGDLQNATIIGGFNQPTNLTDKNGLMQGRAMNGIAFDLTGANSFTVERAASTRVGLTAAIIQNAQQSPGGLSNQIQTFGMINITETLYELYLTVAARQNYFVPTRGNMEVGIKTFQPRLWIVDFTAHLLAGILVAFAASGAIVHILHRKMRDRVILPHRPGTLASAAAFTARSNIADVLDGNLDEKSLTRVLKDKRFRIDRTTGRIVMEGDDGFEALSARPGWYEK